MKNQLGTHHPAPEKAVESEIPLERRVLKGAFEAILLHAEKINEGANGVIAHVDLSKLPAEIRNYLVGKIEIPNENAIKILKFYSEGAGKREYEAQLVAYEALKNETQAAQAPCPYLYRDISVDSEELREKLSEKMGVSCPKVEIIIMEYIQGVDLATHFFREIVRRDHRFSDKKSQAATLTFQELEQLVPGRLGFDQPGQKGKSLAEKAVEKERVFNNNAELLYSELRKCGFTLESGLIKKLESGLNILHANGIYHRDLHLRNVMIDERGEVYIIDFGTAHISEKDSGEPYPDFSDKSYLEDESLIDLLKSFEAVGLENLPENLTRNIDVSELDDQIQLQISQLKKVLSSANVPITAVKINSFLNNMTAVMGKRVDSKSKACILWAISQWKDLGGEKAVRDYLEEYYPNISDIQETLSEQIYKILSPSG